MDLHETVSNFDQTRGQINYAAGKGFSLPNDSVASPFTLVTVTFQALVASGQVGTDIVFAPLVPPRESKTVLGAGRTNTGQLVPVKIIVN